MAFPPTQCRPPSSAPPLSTRAATAEDVDGETSQQALDVLLGEADMVREKRPRDNRGKFVKWSDMTPSNSVSGSSTGIGKSSKLQRVSMQLSSFIHRVPSASTIGPLVQHVPANTPNNFSAVQQDLPSGGRRQSVAKIFFPKPVSINMVHVEMTDNPVGSGPQPALNIIFEALRGPHKPYCPAPTVINLPLNEETDQYFMVGLDPLPDRGIKCPGTDGAKISKMPMKLAARKAKRKQLRTFLTLHTMSPNDYASLPKNCRIYAQPSLPRHVFLGPFPAQISATSHYMKSIRASLPANASQPGLVTNELEVDSDLEVVDRKPGPIELFTWPKRTPIAVIRFNTIGTADIELFAEEVVRVRLPFLSKKFTGSMDAFKIWLMSLTEMLNSGGFQCLDAPTETLIELSSDEDEEPFIKSEPQPECDGEPAADGQLPRAAMGQHPRTLPPPVEELAKIRWMSNNVIPVYGQKWIGVKHPFRHEKYSLFRTLEGATLWARSLVSTIGRGRQFDCVFSDQQATRDTHNRVSTAPVVKQEPPGEV